MVDPAVLEKWEKEAKDAMRGLQNSWENVLAVPHRRILALIEELKKKSILPRV